MEYAIKQESENLVTNITISSGIKLLWDESLGSPEICVAILDGPVDQSHPCFNEANITFLPTLVSGNVDGGFASQHGTHVASIIFGQHGGHVCGIAPHCRGLIVPVFANGKGGGIAPCSQVDLARAITQAVEQGANVINISGGQLAASAESDQLLANAIRLCQENNVLIVAAAGNDGCDCLHIPAALESVLAVGAMDVQGRPIEFSNWGEAYQSQGVLALGENILGASPGGGTVLKSGTSFAAPIVSGVVALLLSLQLQQGKSPDPYAVRDAILKSTLPCSPQQGVDSRRCLVGRLNISGAYALITQGEFEFMSEHTTEELAIQTSAIGTLDRDASDSIPLIGSLEPSEAVASSLEQSAFPSETFPSGTVGIQAAEAKASTAVPMPTLMEASAIAVTPSNAAVPSIVPSECGCGGGAPSQIAYALGELGTDFGTEARRDSFTQAMPPGMSLLDYLAQNPWEAQSLIWTLNLDATPIYAIKPAGPYANVAYERLRAFLADDNVERVSIPGYVSSSVRLMSGQIVPAIVPEVRGMYSWSVSALVSSVTAAAPLPEGVTAAQVRGRIEDYLNRIYYDYRNLGVTPQERALNFSATNAFQASTAIAAATGDERVLDKIAVTKSPICRPDSDCYDVRLSFFDPENNQRSNRIYRFTIDVSEVIPVTIGEVRSWSQA